MANRSIRTRRPVLRLEELEAREVPALLIQVDYTYDSGFFANNPEARATMERVASELGNSISANLAAIAPSGGNTWTATFHNPATGALQSLANPSVGANTVRLYVGARPLGGGEAGFATTTGFSASGSPGWVDLVQTRSWSGFAPWGGSIAFDSTQRWHFGQTTSGLDGNELDFYSVAMHELGHVLGMGTSKQWHQLSQNGAFRGSNAMSVYGGPVPVSGDGLHWAAEHAAGAAVSLGPTVPLGKRDGWSALDAAALRDLGWAPGGGDAGSSVGPPGTILFAMAGVNAVIGQYGFYAGTVFPTGRLFLPFPGYAGSLQQGIGDFNGDAVYDVAVSTPGAVGVMAIVSGLDGRVIGGPKAAHGSVAAMFAVDVDVDGRHELVTIETIGPRVNAVYVYSLVGGSLLPFGAVSAYGEAGRAALHVHDEHEHDVPVHDGDVDRTGYGDALAPDDSHADDLTAETPVATSDEEDHLTAIATAPVVDQPQLSGDEALIPQAASDDEAAGADFYLEDDLLSAIRVG
jgi:hypothetical protein